MFNSGTFYLKGGFDGASSQSIYKQKYEDTDLTMAISNKESLFQTAIVPLKLVIGDRAVWANKKPNSSHFCRPLNLQYKKESKQLAIDEKDDIMDQLENIGVISVFLEKEGNVVPVEVKVHTKLDLTMFDGKIFKLFN